MKKVIFILFSIVSITYYSQNVGINSTGAIPNISAGLDIDYTNKGLLIPRVALTSTTDAVTVPTPTTSLLVYNTNAAMTNGSIGYYYNSGTTTVPAWLKLITSNVAWLTTGNSNIIDGTHFIGTTNNIPFNIKVNNEKSGRIDPTLKNLFLGYQAGNSNNIAEKNVAVGHQALFSNLDANDNTALGYQSLFNTINGVESGGNENTAVGSQSLFSNLEGFDNTAVGYNSLYSNQYAYNNTALGSNSLYNTINSNNNVAIGSYALFLSTNNYNTSIGASSGNLISSGLNNTTIGYNAQVPTATGNNQVRIGSTGVTYAGIQVAWSITSDKRWKEGVKKNDLGLDFIKTLNPVSYYRTNDELKKIEYGFIAQELEEALNKAGATNNGIITKDDYGYLSVRYNDLLAPIVCAIKEQQIIIEKEQLKNKQLEHLLEVLTERLNALEVKLK